MTMSPKNLEVTELRRRRNWEGGGAVTERAALVVDVVEPVGAGDAFAAGLLTGLVRGEDVGRCLRRGHLGAAAVLVVPGDSAAPLPEHLLDLDDDAWAERALWGVQRILPVQGQPLRAWVSRWPDALPVFNDRYTAAVVEAEAALASHPIVLAGSAFHGSGIDAPGISATLGYELLR